MASLDKAIFSQISQMTKNEETPGNMEMPNCEHTYLLKAMMSLIKAYLSRYSDNYNSYETKSVNRVSDTFAVDN